MAKLLSEASFLFPKERCITGATLLMAAGTLATVPALSSSTTTTTTTSSTNSTSTSTSTVSSGSAGGEGKKQQ